MYTAKHAMLYKHKVHDGQAYVFYMDIRAAGKGYDEFVQRIDGEDGVKYMRGRVSKVYRRRTTRSSVLGADTLTGQQVEIDADMVVLAPAMAPSKGTAEIAQTLKIGHDKDGFLTEAHPKLRPVESNTAGIFLAGAARRPRTSPRRCRQASAAAAKVIRLLSKPELEHAPTVAKVREFALHRLRDVRRRLSLRGHHPGERQGAWSTKCCARAAAPAPAPACAPPSTSRTSRSCRSSK